MRRVQEKRERPKGYTLIMATALKNHLCRVLALGLLGLTFFPSVVASEEDTDLKDIKGTRKCKDPTYRKLRKDFVDKCKEKDNRPQTCFKSDACTVLDDKIKRFRECIVAREALMNQCFDGGDDGHQKQVEELEIGLKNCKDMLEECKKKEGNQCPNPG